MNICVVGWYFENRAFYDSLPRRFPVFVLKHRDGDSSNLAYALHPNVGLEFGAYQQYLDNHWDHSSDVLFIQDDTLIHDDDAFDQIASLSSYGVAHAYIFRDEYEEICNGGAHGRAMFCSAEFLTELSSVGGFPYDRNNLGLNTGGKENTGIQSFIRKLATMGNLSIGLAAIIPGLQFGRRGTISNQPYVFDRKDRERQIFLKEISDVAT